MKQLSHSHPTRAGLLASMSMHLLEGRRPFSAARAHQPAPTAPSLRAAAARAGLGAVAAGLVDVQQIPLYDRVIIAVATLTTSPIQFFTVPIGSGTGISGVKQLWDTNLTQASRLENPRSFLVRAVRFYIEPDVAPADLTSLYKNYVLVLIVGEKIYQLAPIWFFPQGGGMYMGGNLSTARLASTIQEQSTLNGLPDPNAINVIAENLAVKIEQGENFRVELQGNPFTTTAAAGTVFGQGLNMRCVLDGVLSRQVQ